MSALDPKHSSSSYEVETDSTSEDEALPPGLLFNYSIRHLTPTFHMF